MLKGPPSSEPGCQPLPSVLSSHPGFTGAKAPKSCAPYPPLRPPESPEGSKCAHGCSSIAENGLWVPRGSIGAHGHSLVYVVGSEGCREGVCAHSHASVYEDGL